MTAFIFHHAYHSGGRWHIAKDAKVELVKGRYQRNDDTVIDYYGKHVNAEEREKGILEGKEYAGPYDQRAAWHDRWHNVDVPANPGYYLPVLGHVLSRTFTPEHVVVTAKAACGQVTKTMKVSNLYQSGNTWRTRTAKKYIGEFVEITDGRIGKLLYENDTIVPEPLCQYCYRLLATDRNVKTDSDYVGK